MEDPNRETREHPLPTAQDVPGTGGARIAAEKVESRKKKQKARLDEIMGKIKN